MAYEFLKKIYQSAAFDEMDEPLEELYIHLPEAREAGKRFADLAKAEGLTDKQCAILADAAQGQSEEYGLEAFINGWLFCERLHNEMKGIG